MREHYPMWAVFPLNFGVHCKWHGEHRAPRRSNLQQNEENLNLMVHNSHYDQAEFHQKLLLEEYNNNLRIRLYW